MSATYRCTCGDDDRICDWCEARIEDHMDRVHEAHADDWRIGQDRYEREVDSWGPQT